MFAILNLLLVGLLFAAMLAVQAFGRRLGTRDHAEADENKGGSAAAEGTVYGLLGLLLAFTFSGAGARYEARWHLVVDEANAIGTAWLRLDLLPSASQPPIRDLFRQYLDARIATGQTSLAGLPAARDRATGIQQRIWTDSVAAAAATGQVAPNTLLLPALNEMFDIAATREQDRYLHPPVAVFVMLAILALTGALFAGYGMAGKPRSLVHRMGFAVVLALALFVIIDFEFPRFGFIRLDAAESMLTDLRRSMN